MACALKLKVVYKCYTELSQKLTTTELYKPVVHKLCHVFRERQVLPIELSGNMGKISDIHTHPPLL